MVARVARSALVVALAHRKAVFERNGASKAMEDA
jgi:hypothetical protein